MKKSIRSVLALVILFVGTSAVATTQFDGGDFPPMCVPGTVCQ